MKAESTQPDAHSTAFAQALALGQSLLGAGRHLDALKHFARVLEESPDQADAYEAASQALVAATLSDEPILETWDENDRDHFISYPDLARALSAKPPDIAPLHRQQAHWRGAGSSRSHIPQA